MLSVPKSGKTGSVVYVNSKYGVIERELVIPHNAQAPEQQEVRGRLRPYHQTMEDSLLGTAGRMARGLRR